MANHSPPFPLRPLLVALVAVLAPACTGGASLGVRTGPDFAVAFADASVLVSTAEPAVVRTRLAQVKLPATQEHHDRLLALLAGESTISAPHLLLLVEAVALPTNGFVVHSVDSSVHVYGARGKGEFAPVVDQLITAGVPKMIAVDRASLGALLGRTQSDATLRLLADGFLPPLDDGSEQALREILAGMPGSPALLPFLTEYLAPQGRLDGERGWWAVSQLSFDSERLALIEALAARPAVIDGARLLATIKTMSFDDGRQQGLALLADKVPSLSADVARDVVATFSFDDGRQAACATLVKDADLQIDEAGLVRFVGLCSFDSGRLSCVKLLAPRLQGDASADSARALLAAFSFDSDRLEAVKVMAPRWRELTITARKSLLGSFSFDSNKAVAEKLLMR